MDEEQPGLCAHAVTQLLSLVDYFWFEISDALPRLITLTGQLGDAQPVWLLLAKVHFHLGNYGESVQAALQAGDLFDLSEASIFVQTISAKAIDQYVALREEVSASGGALEVDAALEALVNRMITQCTQSGQLAQAVGIAIDAHRLDVVKAILELEAQKPAHGNFNALLAYTRQIALRHISKLPYQMELLKLTVEMASTAVPEPDAIFIAECLVALGDADGCVVVLGRLLDALAASEGKDERVRAILLQIALNIADDASQHLVRSIAEGLQQQKGDGASILMDVLGGRLSTEVRLQFLCRNNHADMAIMERTKEALNAHNSMHHSVLSCSNALMHCGTTNDEFMRKNLDWLSYATNWAKFTAASSLGVVHKGQLGKGRDILKPYLPVAGEKSGSVYAEGGSLFALGLISAGLGDAEDISVFRAQIQQNQGETREDVDVLLHGATLGLGVAAMSTANLEYVQDIKGVLFRDMANSGEAAAVAIGLILHGTGDMETINELLLYASETEHEKTQRGIALAVSLIFAGLRQQADTILAQLLASNNAVMRYGAVWTLASAYAGSGDNGAVARLLHLAVSDVAEEVCRSAVMALGFLLCRTPDELPRIVELLTESYNPHVRYGAAMALGIAFAGSGNKLAIELIRPLCKDFTDFVRQAAYIALGLIMALHNEVTCEEVPWARSLFETVIGVKHEDPMAKFGAVLAQGLIDAGGRNSRLTLISPSSGLVDHGAVAGTLLFCQFWYWYPFTSFVSLALRPAALTALDAQLRRPQMEVLCVARPSRFALPPPLKGIVSAAPKKLVTAILSTTAKAAARARKKSAAADVMMDVEGGRASASRTPAPVSMDVDKVVEGEDPSASGASAGGAVAAPPPAPTPEPESYSIGNFSRITPTQLSTISFPSTGKYAPISGIWHGEIVILQDNNPQIPSEYLSMEAQPIKPAASSSDQNKTSPIEDGVKTPVPFQVPDYLKDA